MTMSKMTAKERLQYRYFFDGMARFEWDLRHEFFLGRLIPDEWQTLLHADRSPRKGRITLRLDEDVLQFFRKQFGPGYQTRINAVLRSFLKLKLSNCLDGPEGLDVVAKGLAEDILSRPQYGTWEKLVEGGQRRRAEREARGEPELPDWP